jgi:hypothetical protein
MPARLTVGFGLEVARPRRTPAASPRGRNGAPTGRLGSPAPARPEIEGHPWSSGAGLGIPTGRNQRKRRRRADRQKLALDAVGRWPGARHLELHLPIAGESGIHATR